MSKNELKLRLIKSISQTEDETLLKELNFVLEQERPLEMHELPEELRVALEISLAQANEGNFISHEDVMKEAKKWNEEFDGRQKRKAV